MTQAARLFLASAVLGASLVGLAGCGNNTATGNATAPNATPPAANAASAGPAAPPATPAAGGPTTQAAAARYCGAIHNSSTNQDDQAEVDINPGAGFSGAITVLGQTLSGGGAFQGTMAGGQCSGVAASSGLSFSGACPSGGEFDGTYAINGQQGTFRMSASGCH